MSTVLVWILILHSWDGGMLKVENIQSWEDCERLRIRAMQSGNERREGNRTVNGTCTQVGLLMPNQVVNVQPTIVPAPVVQNKVVIIKKAP